MKILIPYDGSRNSISAMRLLAGMALNPNSEILILKVVPSSSGFLSLSGDDPVRNQELVNKHSMVLRELAKELASWQKGCNVSFRVHFGKPADSIIEVSEQFKADLIILSPRKPSSMKKFYMGSVSKEVTANANCPVMIVKPKNEELATKKGYKVLVPIDGSLYSYYTIAWLSNQVWKEGTEFKILTAIPEFKEAFETLQVQYDTNLQKQWTQLKQRAFESLEEHAFRLAERVGLENVSIDVEPGAPKKTISDIAMNWKPDIIAMGAPRPTGLNQMILGDVPTHIAGSADCTILIVKRPGQGKARRDNSAMKQALANVMDSPAEERNEPPHAVTM